MNRQTSDDSWKEYSVYLAMGDDDGDGKWEGDFADLTAAVSRGRRTWTENVVHVGPADWKSAGRAATTTVGSYDDRVLIESYEVPELTASGETIAAVTAPKEERHVVGRWIRRCLGVLFVAAGTWWLVVPLFFPLTSQAVVSARLVHVRTPIEGTVRMLTKQVGQRVAAGEPLAEVIDTKLDPSKMTALEEQYKEAAARRLRFERDLDAALTERAAAVKSLQGYGAVFLKWLTHSIDESRARLEAAKATQVTADVNYADGQRLVGKKVISYEDYVARKEAAKIARDNVQADERALKALETEFQAAKQGYYLSSVPSSQDRVESLNLEIRRLNHQLQETISQQIALKAQLGQEREATERLAHTVVLSPVAGVVWRRSEVEGQRVDKAEPLYDIANEQTVYIDALVHQRFLRTIRPGGQVVVNLAGGKTLNGVVRGIQARDLTEKEHSYAMTVPQDDLRYIHVLIDLQSDKPDSSWIGRHVRLVIASPEPGLVERGVMWLFARLRI